MTDHSIQLDIPLLLPEIEDTQDACITQLEKTLQTRKGIEKVHVRREVEPAQLCLHYDPNLISLTTVQRLAQEAGSDFTKRYRHERIPVFNIGSADGADGLAQVLQKIPGMLHTTVNFAAGLVFVAYDSEIVQQTDIEKTIHQMGYRLETAVSPEKDEPDDHEGHSHGSAPGFLPHWLQERWTYLLVALAGIFFLIGWLGETFFAMPENVALIFFILSYITGGYDIATHAIPGLFKGKFDTDVLMLAAALGAAILGEWSEGAFLLFLFALGHAGEHYALDRARNAVSALGELMPKTARVKKGDEIVEQDVETLQIGDIVIVRPGDRMPVDGEIIRGQSAIDQSPITGESVPVNKNEGDEVFAGTINQENALDVRVNKLAKDNTLNRVIEMVADAQEQQSPTQQVTQRFTAKFVPGVLIFVALVIIVPPLLGWMDLQDSFYRGMLLLVAASPCALALGTPSAILAGIAQAARNGVLIKGGVHLENLGSLNVMAFDKTGTLTEGKFKVTNILPLNGTSKDELLRIAAAVEQQSNHPLALAVVQAAQERELTLPTTDGLENIAGRGVKSEIDGQPILIGSLKLFREQNGHPIEANIVQMVEQYEGEGKTTMVISQNGRFLGTLALADTPRPDVKLTLQSLLDMGIKKLVMLTGDTAKVARQIGQEVGVTDIRADLLPEQKLDAIKSLQQEYGSIAMAGDGVNDAPALATATVGIAMGGAGTAVALETADVALMADDLSKLPFAVGLSRASRAIIKQNLVIALAVIFLLIVTSVLGLVQLSGAVILHEGSTILVVLNALRLLRFK
jgi:Cd2+/Zn2+-exporting ATPase